MTAARRRRCVAIACEGGGSHTAFTAGVLKRLVADDRFDIVALSGTSGGAVCAYLAWHGVAHGDRALSARLLDEFWGAMAASEPGDALLNQVLVGAARLEGVVAMPQVSPYAYPPWGQHQFRALLDRLVPHVDATADPLADLMALGDERAATFLAGQFQN